jgi:hypothetical protein
MTSDRSLPAAGLAEIRITAATPDVARLVAQVLREWFAGAEQRSYPAGVTGHGTCLRMTVDTAGSVVTPAGHLPWPAQASVDRHVS